MVRTLGGRIRLIADEAEISLNELARRARMDRAYLGRVLNGQTPSPGIANVARIARALGVTLSELLEGVEFD